MAGMEDFFPRSKVKNPCHKCDERSAECHAGCERHAKAALERQAEKAEMDKRRLAGAGALEYTIDQVEKQKKKRRNQNMK